MKFNQISFIFGILGAVGIYISQFPTSTLVSTSGYVLIAGVVLGIASLFLQTKKINLIGIILGIGIVLFLLEAFATHSGAIYGSFNYHPNIPLQLFNTPVVMIGIWGLLCFEFYNFTEKIITKKPLFKILVTALLLLTFDLVMDPGAVDLGLWSWDDIGFWFGIPLSNFMGWFVMGIMGATLYHLSRNIITKQHIHTPNMVLSFMSLGFWSGYLLTHEYIPLGVFGILYSWILYSYIKKTSSC